MPKKIFLLTTLLSSIMLLTPIQHLHALSIDYTIGTRIGIGISTAATRPFLERDATGATNSASYNFGATHANAHGAFGVFADFGFLSWFALTPQFTLYFGDSTQITDPTSAFVRERLNFMEMQFDLLAKFRIGWIYIGLGPGFGITTAPSFRNSDLADLYRSHRQTAFDFLTVVDVGMNVPVGAARQHHIHFSVRTVANVTGMIAMRNARNRWESSNRDDNLIDRDSRIRGVSAVRGTFMMGYMYRF